MDPRWRQLADVLVTHSTGVQPGERVMIAMGELASYPLAQAVYEAVVKAGGFPQVQFLSETLRHALLCHGTDEQLAWVPEIEAYGMAWADVYFGLRGAADLDAHADIPAHRLATNQVAQGQVSALRWAKTRWCLVRVPTAALAQQAQTTLDTLQEMFFAACLLDWQSVAEAWRGMAARLAAGTEVRIVGTDTDLRFSVAGRSWIALDGRLNMPDGEIMTAPVARSVNGQITFEAPGVFGGRLIDGIRLGWRDGQLIEATATTNQDLLQRIVDADAGASRLGEFAFGVNPYLTRFARDILLDEKIGGTIHIALGRAYPECGGTNTSAIHWDIVKDLREAGVVYLDGRPIQQQGALLI
jgi:aminopeptidase